MGLMTLIGAGVGSLVPGVGTAVGAAAGGILDGFMSDTKNPMDEAKAEALRRQAKWESLYGSTERNLAAHVSGLSAANIVAKGNDALEKSYAKTQQRLMANLESRGIDTKSGIASGAISDSLNRLASRKAMLFTQADDYVAKQQASLLNSNKEPDTTGVLSKYGQAQLVADKQSGLDIANGVSSAIDFVDKIKNPQKVVKAKNPQTVTTNYGTGLEHK